MKTPLARIRIGAVVLAAVFILAVVVYALSGEYSLIGAIWVTVVTLSSVGFGEESKLPEWLQVFEILIIIFGISASVYTMGGFFQLMTEGEIERVLSQRRMTRGIERLEGHVIVCGYGRMGQLLADELAHRTQLFVVVDRDLDRIALAQEHDYLVLSGDATEEDVLYAAGIERAKALITSLPGDADNVFITLTARNMNKDLLILARAEFASTQKKLLQAGANRVVMPAAAGAQRMARMITRPSTADWMDLVADEATLDVELDEVRIQPGSPLVGKTVREANARQDYGLLVVSVKQASGAMVFNPAAEFELSERDIVIVMGHAENIEKFREQCSGSVTGAG